MQTGPSTYGGALGVEGCLERRRAADEPERAGVAKGEVRVEL